MPMTPEQAAQFKEFLKLVGGEVAAQLIPVFQAAMANGGGANPNARVVVIERDENDLPRQKATTLPQLTQELIDIMKDVHDAMQEQIEIAEGQNLKKHRRAKKKGAVN